MLHDTDYGVIGSGKGGRVQETRRGRGGARRPDDGVGPTGEGRKAAGARDGEGGGREKIFLMVGHVPVYGGLYGEGKGRRKGENSAVFIWDVQHPQRSEWGTGVCTARYVERKF